MQLPTLFNRAPFAGYAPDESFPLGAYAGLAGAYALGLGSLLVWGERTRRLPSDIRAGDAILLGLATHKLSRIVTRDWVTSPFRAAFTQYQGSASGGEVNEKSRGKAGLRRALGDLLVCTYCIGPWVAFGLGAGLVARPRAARLVMSIFAAVAASDFLHRTYGLLEEKKGLAKQEASAFEAQAKVTNAELKARGENEGARA